jgi:hypothetical protein
MNRMFVSPQGEFLTLLERRISWIEIDSHGIFFWGGPASMKERNARMLYSRLDGMTKPCDLPNWFDINIFDQQAKKHWKIECP